jgi:hypothetical protein
MEKDSEQRVASTEQRAVNENSEWRIANGEWKKISNRE